MTVGMSGQYFPFTFVEQDELKGFEVDIMNALGKEMGREIIFQTANFSGLFGMLGAGRIDTVANQITITEERQQAYIFSEPYVYDGAQVVVKQGNTEIQDVEDLKPALFIRTPNERFTSRGDRDRPAFMSYGR
jgi:putative amino-acid transport system substrate-binding protein